MDEQAIHIESTETGWELFFGHEKIPSEEGLIDVLREIIKQHGLEDSFEIKEI